MSSATGPRRTIGAGALLFRPDGSVLIGHRNKRGESPTWCLPGGHLEPGETPEQAAVREVAEEAGVLDVTEPSVFAVALDTGSPGGVTIGVLARSAAVAPVNGEPENFDRWMWADPHDLPAPLFPASAALVAAWLDRPVPPGWVVYPVGSTEARP